MTTRRLASRSRRPVTAAVLLTAATALANCAWDNHLYGTISAAAEP